MIATGEQGTPESARLGRPRNRDIDRAVLAAAEAIITEDGAAVATLEAVAARAGTTRASIYRRWRSRADLLVAVLGAQSEAPIPPRRGPRARDDLLALLETFAAMTRGPLGRVGPPIIAELLADPVARTAALTRSPSPPMLEEARARLTRALAESGLPAADLDLRLEAIFGLIFLRALVGRREPETDLPKRVLDLVAPRNSAHRSSRHRA